LKKWVSAGLLIAGVLALVGAFLLPSTRLHPVTPAMLAAAEERAGRRVVATSTEGSGGRMNSPAAVAADRPTVLVFLKDGCPCSEAAEPFFHRLHAAYGTRVAFLGVIDGDRSDARGWADRHRTPYPVLADPDRRIIRACGAERSAYVALVAQGGTIERLWPGFSRGMLAELGIRLARISGLPEFPDEFSGAPEELASGCLF
jgi:peroxiredoxin